MKKYAISDIHGCAKTFKALLQKVAFSKQDELYILGDLIDRGPDSKGVIDHIFDLQEKGYTVQCLRGNHEQMLLDCFEPTANPRRWFFNGGEATLDSFDAQYPQYIDEKYLQFLEELPYYLEVDNYILVHAGLNFDMPNPFDAKHSLMWIRNWYNDLNYSWLGDRIIIHGHTPQKQPIIKKSLSKLDDLPILCIDSGCPFKVEGYGHLCAFEMTEQRLYFCPNEDY